MRIREFTRWAMVGGAVAALGVTAPLAAQVDTTRQRVDTTTRARSTQRIPIRKESRGEVVLPSRTDSMARAEQARNDSIMMAERARNDSIAAAERARADALRADSIAQAARTDSIARAEQARIDSLSRLEHARADSMVARDSTAAAAVVVDNTQRFSPPRSVPGAFYFGVGGGMTSPVADLDDLGYDGGLSIAVPIGWHKPSSTLGFRLLLGYSQMNGGQFSSGGASPVILSNPDPKVYSAEANLTARFPFGGNRMSSLYLTGGGGVYMFRNFGQGSALAGYLGNDVLDPNDEANESSINKWGVNGGAGLEFGINTAALFVETRIVNVFTGRGDEVNFDNVFGARGTTARWIPLIVGVTWR